MQRTLERLATARGIAVPEQLGFPKELPPSDTVPRLLLQLSIMREVAELMLQQGVTVLSSLKVEDPEAVTEEEGKSPFLVRLPVRVRFTSSLPHLLNILAVIHRVTPLIDVRLLKIALPAAAPTILGPSAPSQGGGARGGAAPAATPLPVKRADTLDAPLEVELLLARHLVLAAAPDAMPGEIPPSSGKGSPSSTRSGSSTARKRPRLER